MKISQADCMKSLNHSAFSVCSAQLKFRAPGDSTSSFVMSIKSLRSVFHPMKSCTPFVSFGLTATVDGIDLRLYQVHGMTADKTCSNLYR